MQVPTLDNSVIGDTLFVPENVCFGRKEDLAFPECDRSQPEQHYPYGAHQDSHDGVQDKKSRNLKGVTENAKSRDPADVREGQGPAYVKDTNRKSKADESEKRDSEPERVLTSKDFTELLVYFEPVRQQAKCEEEYGKAEKEDTHKHARGEPDLTGERRDEIVLRKAVSYQSSKDT